MHQQMLGSLRSVQRTSLPRLCVVVVVVTGLVVLADLVPRMVILTSQPRETAYWEAWEEAYVDRRAHASAAYCRAGSQLYHTARQASALADLTLSTGSQGGGHSGWWRGQASRGGGGGRSCSAGRACRSSWRRRCCRLAAWP